MTIPADPAGLPYTRRVPPDRAALVAAFLAARPTPAGQAPDGPALGAKLEAVIAAGRAAWPTIAVPDDALVAYLAERVTGQELAQARAPELYLACACLRGDPAAVTVFQDQYFTEIDVAARRARADPAVAADARQNLARSMFTGGAPAIATYRGRGDLRGWMRISAMREVLRLVKRARREVLVDVDTFVETLSPVSDPELAFLKEHYRQGFADAVREAIGELSDRERALLQQQLAGLTVDDLAAHYEVHRSTAGRWMMAARTSVLEITRKRLMQRWGASSGEIDSVIRLLSSRLELSLERVLADG